MRFRAFVVPCVLLSAIAAQAADWPQWRGPSRDGRVTGEGWPSTLEGLEPVWRLELGKGYPGPIVGGDRVFVVETIDDETVGVRALDRKSGEVLWSRTWPGTGKVPFFASANGDWVRSTPVFDGETLFVGDMNETLVALDGATGEARWRVSFPERFGTKPPDFGFASSPLADGDALYVQGANSIVKLNKKTGETIWRRLDGKGNMMSSGAFSSPIFAELDGRRQLLVQTRTTLHGLTEEGDVLWSHDVPHFRGMNILTPAVHGDAVFTSSYQNGSRMFAVGGEAPSESWTYKASAYMSSPVIIDGHAYLHLQNQRVACIRLADGAARWTTEKRFGKYWSMAWQKDKILALDERGVLYLLQANPEAFTVLDQREISEDDTWGHIAVAGDHVFVRELEAIAAYRWK